MFTHSRRACASPRREKQPIGRNLIAGCIHSGSWARCLIAAAMVVVSAPAQAHGIVGNRVFPSTLAFDDPAVMDELVLPAVSRLKHPREGADVVDDRIEGSFTPLLTSSKYAFPRVHTAARARGSLLSRSLVP